MRRDALHHDLPVALRRLQQGRSIIMNDFKRALEASVPGDWTYLSEGGANIVLSYQGHDASLHGRCLRLRKLKSGAVSSGTTEDPAIEYQSKIIAPLLGKEHLPWMLPVRIPETLLKALSDSIKGQRSAERRAEGDVDVESGRGVLVEDLVSPGPSSRNVLTIEIKVRCPLRPDQPGR